MQAEIKYYDQSPIYICESSKINLILNSLWTFILQHKQVNKITATTGGGLMIYNSLFHK